MSATDVAKEAQRRDFQRQRTLERAEFDYRTGRTHMTPDQVALAHAVDDHERQRTSAMRKARETADLLDLARQALDNGDLTVVAEFLDRSIVRVGDLHMTLAITR